MIVRRIVTMKELKKLTSSGQKAEIRDKLEAYQLTQTSYVSGVEINPKPTMFKLGQQGNPDYRPDSAGQAYRKEG